MSGRFHSRNDFILLLPFLDIRNPCLKHFKTSFTVTEFKRFLRKLHAKVLNPDLNGILRHTGGETLTFQPLQSMSFRFRPSSYLSGRIILLLLFGFDFLYKSAVIMFQNRIILIRFCCLFIWLQSWCTQIVPTYHRFAIITYVHQ